MDTQVIVFMIAEGVIALAGLVLIAVNIFKKYKGKKNLTLDEIIELSTELYDYAKEAYDRITAVADLGRSNFNSDEEYKNYLADNFIDDLDELIEMNGAPELYKKITDEDKKKIIMYVIDKLPSKNTTNSNEEVIHENLDVETNSEETDNSQDMVDIGEHLY